MRYNKDMRYNIDKLNRKELIHVARYNTKFVNERIKTLKEWDESETINYIEEKTAMFAQLTNTKNIRKIATGNLSKFNKKKLKLLIIRQKQFLGSKWSSVEGRKEIFEKSYKTLLNTNPDLTRQQLKNFQHLMADLPQIGNELKEQNYLPSNQLIEIAKNYSSADIVQVFSEMGDNLTNKEITSIGRGNYKDFVDKYLDTKQKYNNITIRDFYHFYRYNKDEDSEYDEEF